MLVQGVQQAPSWGTRVEIPHRSMSRIESGGVGGDPWTLGKQPEEIPVTALGAPVLRWRGERHDEGRSWRQRDLASGAIVGEYPHPCQRQLDHPGRWTLMIAPMEGNLARLVLAGDDQWLVVGRQVLIRNGEGDRAQRQSVENTAHGAMIDPFIQLHSRNAQEPERNVLLLAAR